MCSKHTASPHATLIPTQSPNQIMYSLASIPLLLITEDKGGPTHGQKQRVSPAQWKQALPVLPSLVKLHMGRGNV